MIRRPPRSTLDRSSAASDVYKRQPDVLSIVSGASERLADAIGDDDVGVEAPDDTTLIVTLEHPASYFLDIVATPATFVVPPTADATGTWKRAEALVGSGPYV